MGSDLHNFVPTRPLFKLVRVGNLIGIYSRETDYIYGDDLVNNYKLRDYWWSDPDVDNNENIIKTCFEIVGVPLDEVTRPSDEPFAVKLELAKTLPRDYLDKDYNPEYTEYLRLKEKYEPKEQ